MMYGIPCPACWLIEVDREFLSSVWPDAEWPETLICFCAQTPLGSSPMSVRSLKSERLAMHLNHWPHIAKAVALHECAGNFRTIGLARAGLNNYFLYDGAGMYGGEGWTAQRLRTFHSPVNPMAYLAGWCDELGRPSHDKTGDVLSAISGLFLKMNELEFYLNGMLPRECANAASIFLTSRFNLRSSRWNVKAPSNS